MANPPVHNRVLRLDPLAQPENLTRALKQCECRREQGLVKLRAEYLTQMEIARQIERSTGFPICGLTSDGLYERFGAKPRVGQQKAASPG
jgi:hypothetical protein